MKDILNRILYAEDEQDIRTVASMALEMVGGFSVLTCDGGQDALERAPAFDPQLILLDVMMPGMDGPTTMVELRKLKQFTHTPIVFMTAKVQQTEVAHYKNAGAAGVIPKPFDPMTLGAEVQKIWDLLP